MHPDDSFLNRAGSFSLLRHTLKLQLGILLLLCSFGILCLSSCGRTEREGPPPAVSRVQKCDLNDENPTIVAVSESTELCIEGESFRPTPLSLLTGGYFTSLKVFFQPHTGEIFYLTQVRRLSNTELRATFPKNGFGFATPGWMDGLIYVSEELSGRGPSQGSLRISAYLPPKIAAGGIAIQGGNSMQSSATTGVFVNCLTAPPWETTPLPITVTIQGENLLPDAKVELRVAAGSITGPMSFTASTVSWSSSTQITARFDPGVPLNPPGSVTPISFDLRVTHPDGQKHTLLNAFSLRFIQVACPPPLHVVQVTPGGPPGNPGTMADLNSPLTARFDHEIRTTPNLSLENISNFIRILRDDGALVSLLGVTPIAPDTVSIVAQDQSATTTRWLAGRTYTVHLLPGRGGWERSDATELSGWLTAESIWEFRAGVLPPQVNAVSPPFLYCQDKALVYIYGSNLQPVPQLTLVSPQGNTLALKYPLFITFTEARGYFLGERSLCSDTGFYNLVVTNPDGGTILFSQALFVTDTPVPMIRAIAPEAVPKNTTFQLTISGANFPPSATVAAVAKDLTTGILTYYPSSSTTVVSPSEITADFLGLPAQNYIIRLFSNTTTAVTIYADFSDLVVYDPSGNIPQPVLFSETLRRPRMNLATALAADDLGNPYLYIVGGREGIGSSPLRDIEVFSVGLFGELSQHFSLPQRQGQLETPRHSFAMASLGPYLYAIGGVTDNTGWSSPLTPPVNATFTIEWARVLDPRRVPEISAISAGSGGTLSAGFYSYRVSALEPASDPNNPHGETLPSPSVGVRVSAQGSVTLEFSSLPGATGYVIYRNPGPDQAAGKERYLTTVLASSICSGGRCTFIDTGSIPVDPGGNEPLPPGALSKWQTLPLTMDVARAEFSLVQYAVSGTPFVLLVGGENASGVLGTYSLFSLSPADGALSWVTTESFLEDSSTGNTSPVAGAGITLATSQNASNVPSGEIWVLLSSGRTSSANLTPDSRLTQAKVVTDPSLGTPGTLKDFCTLQPGGSTANCPGRRLNVPQREGGANLLVGNILHHVGGWDGTNTLDTIEDCEIAKDTSPPLKFINCNNNGTGLREHRAFYGYVRTHGFNYIIGGGMQEAGNSFRSLATIELFIR